MYVKLQNNFVIDCMNELWSSIIVDQIIQAWALNNFVKDNLLLVLILIDES